MVIHRQAATPAGCYCYTGRLLHRQAARPAGRFSGMSLLRQALRNIS